MVGIVNDNNMVVEMLFIFVEGLVDFFLWENVFVMLLVEGGGFKGKRKCKFFINDVIMRKV